MPALSSNRVAWQYTGDDGKVYRVAAELAVASQNLQGGALSAGTEPERPTDWTLRRMTCSDGLGHSRVVVIYSTPCPLQTPNTVINVNVDQNSTPLKSSGVLIPEKHKRPNVTRQLT